MRKLVKSGIALKYSSALMIFSVLLLPKFPFIDIPDTFVSVRIEDLVVALVFLVYAFHFFIHRREIIRYRTTKYAIIYLVAGFVSLTSAVFISSTVLPHIGLLHFVRRIEYILPMFVAIELVRLNKNNLNFFVNILGIVTIYTFIYGLGQRYLNWPIIITQNLEYSKGVALRWVEGSHINSTFAGHYDLAAYLVLVLPIFIVVVALVKEKWSRILMSMTTVGGLWLLGFAASRISIVAYLLSAIGALLFSKRIKYIPVVIAVSITVFALSPNLRNRYERFFSVVKSQLSVNLESYVTVSASEIIPQKRETPSPTPTTVPVFEDRSTSIRLKASWPKAIRAVNKNPLLGTGYSSVTLAVDNNYLRILGEVGILGFAGWLLMFAGILRSFVDVYPFSTQLKGIDLAYISSIAASFFGILIIALFIDIYLASKFAIIYWFCIGMALGIIKNLGREI